MAAEKRARTGRASTTKRGGRASSAKGGGSKLTTPMMVGATLLEQLRGPSTRDPEARGLRLRAFAMLALVGCLVGGHVWVRLQAQDLGYADRDLERLIQRLDQERLELEAAVAREAAPRVIRSRALESGLRKALPGQVRRLNAQP